MDSPILSLMMDGIIAVLLAVTVFFAMRLSYHLKSFRDNKVEIQKLIGTLATQIDAAERAVAGLRENAKQSGKDVQVIINDAKALSDELQLMITAGNNLAARLEQGADRVARPTIIEPLVKFDPTELPSRKNKPVENSWRVEAQVEPKGPGFAIRDAEFERGDDAADSNEDFGLDEFSSRAERELFEALQGKKGKDIGGH